TGRQQVAPNRIVKVRAIGTNNPARIGRRLDELRRHRIAGHPQLHRLVVNRIGAAQNLGRGISRILVSANCFQDRTAAGFIISVQYMRQGAPPPPPLRRPDAVLGVAGVFSLLTIPSFPARPPPLPTPPPPPSPPLSSP